jgi:mannan endo-1,4-beta-mannosidase
LEPIAEGQQCASAIILCNNGQAFYVPGLFTDFPDVNFFNQPMMVIIFTRKQAWHTWWGVLFLLCLSAQAFGQRYEAENASLAGGASKQACASCSGGFYVAQADGSLAFHVTLPQEGFYNIYLRGASTGGNKINRLEVDGNSLDFPLSQSQYTTLTLAGAHKLAAGAHQVKITKSWGWINIDYLEFEAVAAADRFPLSQRLVTPNPTPEARALFDFLLDNYGDKIISGVMTLHSRDDSDWLKENTGKEPALLGIDLMHSGRGYTWYDNQTPVRDAGNWYKRNGIPALMWHWRDPSRRTEEFYTKNAAKPAGSDFDISKVSDVHSAEYKAMLADIDYAAGLLLELQAQQVPVIWRPLHEAAGGWFWWGAKGGAPLKALWILMYDRMVNHHGLRNLIWVWTREPDDEAWYPGDAYVDIIGRDLYRDGDHGSQTLEFSFLSSRYNGRKMVALSETGSFPDVDNLVQDGAAWSWYMPWYGAFTRDSRYNTLDLWKKMFAHSYVITLDEMPALKTYIRQDPVKLPAGINQAKTGPPGFTAYPLHIEDQVKISSPARMTAIVIYDAQGKQVKRQAAGGRTALVSFAGHAPGIYFIQVDQRGLVRVVKK